MWRITSLFKGKYWHLGRLGKKNVSTVWLAACGWDSGKELEPELYRDSTRNSKLSVEKTKESIYLFIYFDLLIFFNFSMMKYSRMYIHYLSQIWKNLGNMSTSGRKKGCNRFRLSGTKVYSFRCRYKVVMRCLNNWRLDILNWRNY